ncbi:MAG: glycosyltransferase family 4 protein [Elainellaceae cyanobacterium]
MPGLRIALVVENISKVMGGEAQKIFVYLEKLQQRNYSVWLVCHSRVREELRRELPPDQFEKISFVEDNRLQIFLWKLARLMPTRLRELVFGVAINIIFQLSARKTVKALVSREDIQVVFQPTPNSPLIASALFNLGVPVVVGPLSGGMAFPPNFELDSAVTRWTMALSQMLAGVAHFWMPGKRKADHILVANRRTKEMLPRGYRGTVHEGIIECGVDLRIWNPDQASPRTAGDAVRFVYTGRLVDWKGVNYLLDAFKLACRDLDAVLHIIGDGEMRPTLEAQAEALGIADQVSFLGWMPHETLKAHLSDCDAFVMPSLRESCGNAVLEAMALGRPAIAADWGGPGMIVDSTCGIKVTPTTPNEFVDGLASAMVILGQSPDLRARLGQAGLQRIRSQHFDWDSKVDYITALFEEVCQPLSSQVIQSPQSAPSESPNGSSHRAPVV